jgi:hypothetical protein
MQRVHFFTQINIRYIRNKCEEEHTNKIEKIERGRPQRYNKKGKNGFHT